MLRSVLLALVLGIVNAWAPLAPRVLRAGPLFHGPGGHPGGHPGGPPAGAAVDNSFVNGELRPYAMNLHTRAQAPREGKAEAKPSEKPVSKWNPSLVTYLQFLVDSRAVYQAFEDAVESHAVLAPLRKTGLERVAVLNKDIEWMAAKGGLAVPAVGPAGAAYAAAIKDVASDTPRFINHYYNHYFAHTAGGRMIGKQLAAALLDNYELGFYQWEGEVRALMGATIAKIESIAVNWTREQKDACLEETGPAFKFGGALLAAMN